MGNENNCKTCKRATPVNAIDPETGDCITCFKKKLEAPRPQNSLGSGEFAGYVDDIKFLLSFIPDWSVTVPVGLDPTFYGTGTYEGDMKVMRRMVSILEKYT